MFKVLGLELLVSSGTPILAAVGGDVFRREAEFKPKPADEIAPILQRMTPHIVVVLGSRLCFSTGVASRHLLTTLACSACA